MEITQIGAQLSKPKTCACGHHFANLPTTAKYFDDWRAYYWDCVCQSTLFYPVALESLVDGVLVHRSANPEAAREFERSAFGVAK